MTPAGTSNELDVQNEWEENTHTHTQHIIDRMVTFIIILVSVAESVRTQVNQSLVDEV